MIVHDQLNRPLNISGIPQRIISLVPSQTEFLFDIGLEKEIVGITLFCVHPKSKVEKVDRVGGTKRLNFSKIDQLKPDLIIANKEENNKEDIEQLSKQYPVWVSDVNNMDEALEMMEQLGELLEKTSEADGIISTIINENQKLKSRQARGRVAYLIWNNPIMVAANDTFIDAMLNLAGFENVFESSTRYPEVIIEDLQRRNPDFLFLSSEPFPFKQKHLAYFREKLPQTKVILVDGEMFSWYGSRIQRFGSYVQKIKLY